MGDSRSEAENKKSLEYLVLPGKQGYQGLTIKEGTLGDSQESERWASKITSGLRQTKHIKIHEFIMICGRKKGEKLIVIFG